MFWKGFSLGNVPIFVPIPLPHYSIRPMGVDVPDDFAGKKMKGTATVSKWRQSFLLFLFYIFTGSSSPFLTGDEGKTKQKKKDPQIKLAGYTPTDLFVDCLSLPWGYYSTTAYSLFGTTLFLPWKEERAESESDDSTSSSTGFNKKKEAKEWLQLFGTWLAGTLSPPPPPLLLSASCNWNILWIAFNSLPSFSSEHH